MSISRAAVDRVKGRVSEAFHGDLEAVAASSPSKAERRRRVADVKAEDFAVTVRPDDPDKAARAIETADAVLQNRRTNGGGTIVVGGGYRDTRFSRAFWASREA